MATLPKRESSRRRAKERHRHYVDDDDEKEDINLSDSDEDASWTPFKGKDKMAMSGGRKTALLDDDDEESEEEEDVYPSSGFKKLKQNPALQNLPPPTSLVPPGRDYSVGDFMVLKEDAARESAPIWRLDSKTLLQR